MSPDQLTKKFYKKNTLNKLTYITLFCLLSALAFSGCRRNKIQKTIAEIQKENDALNNEKIEPSTPVVSLEVNESKIQRIKLKTKVNLQSPLFSQAFPANIRIKKDSVMWISVAVGIEVGRALITRDSVKVLDRISRKYYALSLQDLGKQLEFDLDYNLLQSLVLGDLPIQRSSEDSLALNSLYTSLFQGRGNLDIESQIDNVSNKLVTILAQDNSNGARLGITYGDFWELEADLIPQTIFAKIDNTNKIGDPSTLLELNHVKMDVGEINLRFPFNIPNSYSVGTITFPENK